MALRTGFRSRVCKYVHLIQPLLSQGHNIITSQMEQDMVSKLRDICDRHSTPDDISITVFHPWFIYIDQYLAILPQTIQVRRNN